MGSAVVRAVLAAVLSLVTTQHPAQALGIPRNWTGASVDVTVAAQGSATVRADQLGLPDRGVQSMTLHIEVVSGSAEGLRIIPDGALPNELLTTPAFETSLNGSIETMPGVDSELSVVNDGSEAARVRLSVTRWAQAQRQVPAAAEAAFVRKAQRLGVSEGFADMAVWSPSFFRSTPTTVIANTTTRTTAGDRKWPKRLDAASGFCDGNYKLSRWSHTAVYANWEGSLLWTTAFRKRFCFSVNAKRVGSTYFSVDQPVFSGLASTSWNYVGTQAKSSQYLAWNGSEQGAHKDRQVEWLQHCVVAKFIFCDDRYYAYWVQGFWDGSKTAGGDW